MALVSQSSCVIRGAKQRGVVRHAADHGETYIFDSSLARLLQDATFPDWWLEAWR